MFCKIKCSTILIGYSMFESLEFRIKDGELATSPTLFSVTRTFSAPVIDLTRRKFQIYDFKVRDVYSWVKSFKPWVFIIEALIIHISNLTHLVAILRDWLRRIVLFISSLYHPLLFSDLFEYVFVAASSYLLV